MVRRRHGAAEAVQQPQEPAAPEPAPAVMVAFECDRAALVTALRRVRRAIDAKTVMPILALAHVEVETQSIRITGTDLVVGVSEEIVAVGELPGRFLLPMSLLDLLSTSDAERVTIRVDAKCVVRATYGRRSGEYASAIAENYPVLPKCPELTTVEGRVLELLAQVAHCQSEDQAKPFFTATLYEYSRGRLHLVATDGRRLGFRSIEREGQGSILLPAEFVGALSLLDKSEPFDLGRYGSSVFARQGRTLVFGKLVDARFPNWSQVIDEAKSPVVAECDRAALLSALRGMTAIDDKLSARVALAFDEHELVVTARDSSGSRNARAVIPLNLTGRPFRGEINGSYMIAALSTSKAERVVLEIVVEKGWSRTVFVRDEHGGEIVMSMGAG